MPTWFWAAVPLIVPDTPAQNHNLFILIGGAFIVGLLLNIMPCVLPVLSLKVVHLVEAAGHGGAWKHGVMYALGILATFWAVAAVLLGIRAGGEQIGWGFQLQDPWVVAILAVLFTIIACMLFGVFEFGLSLTGLQGKQSGGGLGSAFMGGVLATVAATPCAGPGMGAAIGVALTGTSLQTIAIFTAMALGLASPLVVLRLFLGP